MTTAHRPNVKALIRSATCCHHLNQALAYIADPDRKLMALRKEETSVATFGVVHSRYKRRIISIVYRQLYSTDRSVLPSIKGPETLPFT